VYTAFAITPTPTFNSNTAFNAIPAFTGTATETEQFWFHPDHLGSSNYITNFVGEVSQHMEYFAFGETFVEEHKNSHNSPYKFNGKELDEESGYTYYGARYLDMRYSIWTATDPLSGYNPVFEYEHYVDGQHNGGVFNHFNHNTYGYCYQNPILFVDPNGKQSTYQWIVNNANKYITNTAAASLGAADATASALSLGLGDLFGVTDHSDQFKNNLGALISYYIGRALADIAMIASGDGIAASGAGTALAGCGTGPGAVVISTGGLITTGYGSGVALTGTYDLSQTLAILLQMGVALDQASNSANSNDEPSASGSYENPGHHDAYPKQKNPNNYNPEKSVLPENHESLWKNSVADPKKADTRWAKEGKGNKATYHRFQNDGNGNWHWNGSTSGKTKSGKTRVIDLKNVPQQIKNMK